MLRVVAHTSAAAARQYYAEGLKREDYYSEGQEVVGKWHGKAAEKLGLTGDVTPEAFARLVENRHPLTGDRLTPRTRADRRVGYDLNFHAPKSLSVIHALTGDRRIVAAFREAVAETMAELEERVGTRVRKQGAKGSRVTGNFAWAEFLHFTARPVGGVPDPHLHVHAFTFNCTHDAVEQRWKAAEFHDIKADAPYAEAAFHARLAGKVASLGYQVTQGRHGWEVAGVPRAVIEKFSRRKAQIEEAAQKLGITDPKSKDALGASTREGKRRGLGSEELRREWKSRLTSEEIAALQSVVRPPAAKKATPVVTAREAMDHAFEKCFARDSVIVQSRLVIEALKYSLGALKADALWRELAKRELIVRKLGSELLCTTVDVLAEEVKLIDFVRSGRGKFAPLAKGKISLSDKRLSSEQTSAVENVLRSTSQVIAIRGAAGVGKTTLMKEAAAQIEKSGLRIFAFAPSAAASRGTLREAGFENANTVAHLLMNPKLQQQTQGQVIWIDEAGLLGMRELWQVMQIAGRHTRVILTGDSLQHAPVARGDAFRLVQHYAGLPLVEVTQIRRQERELYKRAVTALSRGDLPGAFRRLTELGAMIEVADDAARYARLAGDYLALSHGGHAPLVVSPTHAEGKLATDAIRAARMQAGQLRGEREFTRFQSLHWDSADKKNAINYSEGLLVQFHQNAKGIVRGAMLRVAGREDGKVMVSDASGRKLALPLQQAERFEVFREESINLARGDRIRITRNGDSLNGRRLFNGHVFTVEKFTRSGNIVLNNGAELEAKHGHLAHGYCSTSHSAQSKSVRDVLVAQSKNSFVASSQEQFYVSVSRGKQTIRIYTDDLRGLQEAVGISSTRLSGIELAGLSSKDVDAMSEALSSKQWRDAIRSRVVEAGKADHVSNLRQERKGVQPRKGAGMSWRTYVEMRRSNAGADGKSRSVGNGSPHVPDAQKPEDRLKALRERKPPGKPKQGPQQKPDDRAQRRAANMESSAEHFRKVRGGKNTGQEKEKQKQAGGKKLRPSDAQQASKHAVKQRAAEQAKRAAETRKKVMAKQQVVRPPTPRK